MSNVDFPDVDRLATEGLPLSSKGEASAENGEAWKPSPEWQDEWARCREELPDGDQIHPAQALFAHMRGAWLDVMGEIEETDEVQERAAGFRDCLRENGIPPEWSADEVQMLTYVDRLRLEADDREAANDAGVRYGKLYAECGRELFETRERLRGGERRVEFLEEHADAVRELSDLLYGN